MLTAYVYSLLNSFEMVWIRQKASHCCKHEGWWFCTQVLTLHGWWSENNLRFTAIPSPHKTFKPVHRTLPKPLNPYSQAKYRYHFLYFCGALHHIKHLHNTFHGTNYAWGSHTVIEYIIELKIEIQKYKVLWLWIFYHRPTPPPNKEPNIAIATYM